MKHRFLLIPGRTSRQGCGISQGKFSAEYQQETSQVQMAPEDMQRLAIRSGARVRLSNAAGTVDAQVIAAKDGELPSGVLFVPYGDLSSRLMDSDTHGSGMPTSKGFEVHLEVLSPGPEESPSSQGG